MAHQVEYTLRVKVPSNKIWEVLKDFSSVERFATTIDSSPIVGDKAYGLGAKRKCTFHDGSTLVEEIIDFDEGKGFKMNLSEFTLPLKSMQAGMWVKEVDAHTSDISMTSEFVVKGGPLGWVMGSFLMRPMMKGVFKKLLSGLAYHTATGQVLDKNLPSREELRSKI